MTEDTEKFVMVSLDIVWEDSYRKHDARLSELSISGGHIDCLSHGNIGEKFNFKLRLPSGHWIASHGQITYSSFPTGFGFKFLGLSGADKKLIAQVIVAAGGSFAKKYLTDEIDLTNDKSNQHSKKRNKILIAEDDPMTLRIVSAVIESQNFKVVKAEDGLAALQILQDDQDFCAAIFDMMMPHFDGLDLIQCMKNEERLSKIPIGIITAEQDPKLWDDSITAGANIFLPKPFSPQQMKMMLSMLTSENKSQTRGSV